MKRLKKNDDSLRELRDNMKCNNNHNIGISGEEEKGIEKLFEKTMTENFPNRPLPRHNIIKMPKVKDKKRILKAAKEKQQVTYKGAPIRLSADFSTETLKGRRNEHEIFQIMKNKDLQPRLLYTTRLSFKIVK